ncbi:uncharacterized oxidoreductase -like isoform X1 [Pelobates cultripes]|uniref:Uncharacterized oxidoreductase -like isoform X1 n=1 Tax=Pelobates cultripes TaxID=61616 RepID=A0AAD1STK7_PELCU|nr:uncharacterized oxidoreductase -like isoform X1 [Pelobates cultripes]
MVSTHHSIHAQHIKYLRVNPIAHRANNSAQPCTTNHGHTQPLGATNLLAGRESNRTKILPTIHTRRGFGKAELQRAHHTWQGDPRTQGSDSHINLGWRICAVAAPPQQPSKTPTKLHLLRSPKVEGRCHTCHMEISPTRPTFERLQSEEEVWLRQFAMRTLHLGICRSIGVSNFLIHHLEQLKEDCSLVPHLNQVEFHPFQRPHELLDYCKRNNIVFGGYCPLAKGQALTHPVVLQLAKRYEKTPAQICIRWSIQNGVVTIPKSTKEDRIQENCEVFDFHLEQKDMECISSLHSNRKLIHLTYPLWRG